MFDFEDWCIGLLSKANHKHIETIFLPETKNTQSTFSVVCCLFFFFFFPSPKAPSRVLGTETALSMLISMALIATFSNLDTSVYLYTFPRGQVIQSVIWME